MRPRFRIRYVNEDNRKGYVVEYKKRFLFFTYWTHFISYAGLPSVPFYYISEERARKDMLKEIEWDERRQSYLLEENSK